MTAAALALLSVACAAQPDRISLTEAIQSAYRQRPAIAAAQSRMERAQAMARMLGAFPSTELALGITGPPEAGGSDDDFVLSQQLDLFGRTRAGRAVGESLVSIEEARLQAAALEVQTQVMKAYGAAAAAEQSAQVSQRILETAQALYESSQRRFEEGRVPEVQVIRARIEQRRAEQDHQRRAGELEAALMKLSLVVGLPEASAQEDGLTVSFASTDIAGSVNRPDVREKRAEVELASRELEQVRASYRPTFAVQGRRSGWNEPAHYGLRLQFTMPLFDHGLKKAETEAAEKQIEAAKREYEEVLLQANLEVATAQSEEQIAREQLAGYRQILEEARTLVAKSQLGYEEGATTLIEVLEATRAMREVEEGYVEAQASYYQAHVRLLAALGRLLEDPNA